MADYGDEDYDSVKLNYFNNIYLAALMSEEGLILSFWARLIYLSL